MVKGIEGRRFFERIDDVAKTVAAKIDQGRIPGQKMSALEPIAETPNNKLEALPKIREVVFTNKDRDNVKRRGKGTYGTNKLAGPEKPDSVPTEHELSLIDMTEKKYGVRRRPTKDLRGATREIKRTWHLNGKFRGDNK